MPDHRITASLADWRPFFVSSASIFPARAYLVDACADTRAIAPTARGMAPSARHWLPYRNPDRAERWRIPGRGIAPDARTTIALGATLPRDGLAPTGSGA